MVNGREPWFSFGERNGLTIPGAKVRVVGTVENILEDTGHVEGKARDGGYAMLQ